ncbi:hypothetical protein WAI453_001070 [Rhynchosporium graminicola]
MNANYRDYTGHRWEPVWNDEYLFQAYAPFEDAARHHPVFPDGLIPDKSMSFTKQSLAEEKESTQQKTMPMRANMTRISNTHRPTRIVAEINAATMELEASVIELSVLDHTLLSDHNLTTPSPSFLAPTE